LTWFRLIFSRFSRIEVLQGLLDKELFADAKFSELNRENRPLLLLNSTDIGTGEVFAFTPERFDDICSDLRSLPLSVGVAASAAYPVALSPMNLQNFSGSKCSGNIPPAQWIGQALGPNRSRYINVEEFKRARYANALRHGSDSFRKIDYLHLADGGVADNQGVHSIADVMTSPHSPIKLLEAINLGTVRRVVVIAVNARSDSDTGTDASKDVPGLLSVVNAVVGIPIDATTAYSNASLVSLRDDLRRAAQDAETLMVPGNPLFRSKAYDITIDFDQFRVGQNTMRDKVKEIGTTWTLSPAEIRLTMCAGRMLLWQHPQFQELLMELGASPRPRNADPMCEPEIP
jgi:NTE family protein